MIEVFFLVCMMIAAGSAVDVWYTVAYDLQPLEELNPAARWVLVRWGVAGLVAAKCFVTSAIVAGLWWAFKCWPATATVIAAAVAGAMAMLAVWLWASS